MFLVRFLALNLFVLAAASVPAAHAQHDPAVEDRQPTEGPDRTRLDVERLPPEAIDVTRDLYAHGLFLEGRAGGRGFQGGVGRLSKPGLLLGLAVGYEIRPWLLVSGTIEGSIHRTAAPPPPSPTVFEIAGFVADVRLQLALSARVALWVAGEVGLFLATGDVLPTYGIGQADTLSTMFGASLAVDWHLGSRHHSVGLLAGARLYPALNGPSGEAAIGIHSALYIRYVP